MSLTAESQEVSSKNNVYVFGVTSFLNDVASEMAYWILPAFLLTLGAGPAQLGVIEGVAESVAAGAKLLSGYITDRISRRKPLVLAGYAVANVAKPVLAMATAWWSAVTIRMARRPSRMVIRSSSAASAESWRMIRRPVAAPPAWTMRRAE